jgi:prepilin-type N-terminal cleavage/methylation domain-containing protein/prepilin-type processing-associated H-X9-DG protein
MNLIAPRRHPKAFTLVELLVVIGIIAVLIAILLPAMSTARRQANTVKCLSNMRQVGQAFMFYARDFKGCFPVVRQDFPDDGAINNGPPINAATTAANVTNTYWTDYLLPYVTKAGKSNFQLSTGYAGDRQFEQTKASVFWACPQWDGWIGSGSTYRGSPGVSVFDNGYSMNLYPTCQPNNPASAFAMPPSWETQCRSQAAGGVGRWYKQSQWTHASERMLVCDANLWLLQLTATDAAGTIAKQNSIRSPLATGAGANQIDRYRHGKPPESVGGYYNETVDLTHPGKGKQAFNVLFADFHAATLTDIRQGYKAIRMRYP